MAPIRRRTGAIFSIARTVNMLLLILYPAAWLAPLAEAGVVSWWSGDDITIFYGVLDLLEVDQAELVVRLLALRKLKKGKKAIELLGIEGESPFKGLY